MRGGGIVGTTMDAPLSSPAEGRKKAPRKNAFCPLLWIILGAAAYGLHLCLGRDSALAESIYARGIIAGLRWIWDYTLGLSPIPLLYIFFAAMVIRIMAGLIRFIFRPRRRDPSPLLKKIGGLALRTAGWGGGVVFFFYLLWGFNYNRVEIEQQLGLEIPSLGPSALAAEAEWAARMAAESRVLISGASASALGDEILPEGLESEVRRSLVRALREMGYPAPGRVRVRLFIPGGWMMRFSGSGIYIPFFGESYTAEALLAFEKPFTMAHEMAHGYGITDEGEAGFLALLACRTSSVPVVRYSGFVSYWGYSAGDLSRAAPAAFRDHWEKLPAGIKADILAIQRNWERYRGPLMKVSEKVYDRYLKAQGIDEGSKNYNRVVNLTAAWRAKKDPQRPIASLNRTFETLTGGVYTRDHCGHPER